GAVSSGGGDSEREATTESRHDGQGLGSGNSVGRPAARGAGYRTAAVTFGSQCRLCFRRRGRIGKNPGTASDHPSRTVRRVATHGARRPEERGASRDGREAEPCGWRPHPGCEVKGHTWHT